MDWLRRRPLAMLAGRHLLVHAGVFPQWSAEQTIALAAEVEAVLRGPGWSDFLGQMYGNQPDRWDDSLTGVARLRCIVNALTRMRFCTPDGVMEFGHKESAGAPAGLRPAAVVRAAAAAARATSRWCSATGRRSGCCCATT